MPIVAAVDQSERAELVVTRAADLADAYGHDLHIVHVGTLSVGNLATESTQDSEDVDEASRAAEEVAREIGQRVQPDRSFDAIGLVGNPAEELIAYSQECDAEYIVISGRKKSPVGKALFGSVTQSLLLSADRPVVTVMPQ
ncbi:universal stress protein [Halorarum salinum]|uniref:Universal stress protein n=1 Tax=Halorarum salinum TaxID=2743089 RepID=A0A7D5QIZ9_9EURY|nr:universal stress protein [Halobaculum salinum]QLG61065.1 universal stress protein [Halobaculum salinum]